MSFRVIYEAEARAEFREAVGRYEQQVPGLGVRLVGMVDALMSTIASEPYRFAKVGRHSRKARVLGWPYSIFFSFSEWPLDKS